MALHPLKIPCVQRDEPAIAQAQNRRRNQHELRRPHDSPQRSELEERIRYHAALAPDIRVTMVLLTASALSAKTLAARYTYAGLGVLHTNR